MPSEDTALFSLGFVRVAVPIVLLAISASLGNLRRPEVRIQLVEDERPEETTIKSPRRGLILGSLITVSLSFFLDGLCLLLQSVIGKTWTGLGGDGATLSRTIGLDFESVAGLVATGLLTSIGVWKDVQGIPVWSLRRLKVWVSVALVGSVAEAILELVLVYDELAATRRVWGCLHAVFLTIRIACLAVLLTALAHPKQRNGLSRDLEGPLLESGGIDRTATSSETPVATSTQPSQELTGNVGNPGPPEEKHSIIETSKRLFSLSLLLWPWKSVKLQSLVALCMFSMILDRFIGPAIPLAFGKIIEVLEMQTGPMEPGETSFWPYLLAYSGLTFLQSTFGIHALRTLAWTPISQYMDRQMTRITFGHLFALSLSYHTRRKTGEITKIMSRGAVVDKLIDNLLFFIGPAYVDLIIAAAFFQWMYGWTLALIMLALELVYVAVSLWLSGWMRKSMRETNDFYYAASGIETDVLLNYETVKYFGGEQLETDRYVNATRKTQAATYRLKKSLIILTMAQSWISGSAYLIGGALIAMRIARGELSASDFATFSTYIRQILSPLNVIVFQFQDYNNNTVNAEKLLEFLSEPLDVTDKPGAPDLVNAVGEIEFDNVHFSYDGGHTKALKGVSFKIKKGMSVALVGASGAGKSTILRLLFRLYDVNEGEGRILIDGQDIRDVTQASLRRAIGIVPQEPVLFNESIEYNIGYGKPGSSHKEIETAARLACMHDRITTSFKDGYATLVGERGVRLSGGEKQRVSIARAFLKDSPVLVLDEATSALDTSTEREIQSALRTLMRGRSSLSVAHRLSTIASANLILVLQDGQIVEQGGHRELLEQNGIFAKMWADQVEVTDAELIPSVENAPVEENTDQAPLISL